MNETIDLIEQMTTYAATVSENYTSDDKRRVCANQLTLHGFRNPIEDFHASPHGPNDAQMMRANIIVSETIYKHFDLDNPAESALEGINHLSDLEWPWEQAIHEFLNTKARAKRTIEELKRHVTRFSETIGGQHYSNYLLIDHDTTFGGMARSWYGMPWWNHTIEAIINKIENPTTAEPVWCEELPETPFSTSTIREFLTNPYESLHEEEAWWCISMHLGGYTNFGVQSWRNGYLVK
jgi:hypothetical protein